MIDYTTVRETVEVYLNANFSTLPIRFENTLLEANNSGYVDIIDTDITSSTMDMSVGETKLVEGLLSINIFTQAGSGTELAREAASSLVGLLDDMNVSIEFKSATFMSIGLVEPEKHLYQHNLSVPYSYIYGQDD